MNKILKLCSLLLAVFCLSCTKEIKPDILEPYGQLLEKHSATYTKRNYVAVIASQVINPVDSFRLNSYSISGFANINNEAGELQNVGSIKIGNKDLFPNSRNEYSSKLDFSDLIGNVDRNLFFGKAINVKNSSAIEKDGKIYIPKEFFPLESSVSLQKTNQENSTENIVPITTYRFPTSIIDKNSNLPILWNADPNNEFGEVLLQVMYYPSISKYYNATFPSSIASFSVLTPDDGYYLFSSSSFANFPVGSYVKMILARASTNNTGNINYLSIVEANSIPLLMVSNPQLNGDFTITTNQSTPCSYSCMPSASGGKPPHNFTWYTSTGSNPSLIEAGEGPYFNGVGNCGPSNWFKQGNTNPQNSVPIDGPNTVYITLKIFDANLNSKTITKRLAYSTPVLEE